MYIVSVTIKVKPGNVEEFVQATLANAEATRGESGNARFDVLRAEDDPTRFLLYEAYRTKDDFVAHQKTAHYLAWRDTVKDWMAEPRTGVRHVNVFPGDSGGW
ncbi:MAG: putative quinol monooxygenase [Candidatus Coatesbacteria bacterium]